MILEFEKFRADVELMRNKLVDVGEGLHIHLMEEELTDAINSLGVGIMGSGGKTSVLAVNIEYAYTHIAGIVCATSSNCMVARRATTRVLDGGETVALTDPDWFGGR